MLSVTLLAVGASREPSGPRGCSTSRRMRASVSRTHRALLLLYAWAGPLELAREHGMKAINRGFFISAALSAVIVFVASELVTKDWRPWAAVVIGLILAFVGAIQLRQFGDDVADGQPRVERGDLGALEPLAQAV